MNSHPVETNAPPNSRITELLAGASFYDSWSITSSEVGLFALDYFISAAKHTPRWVDMCMTARNRVARFLCLKDLGTLSSVISNKMASDY